MSRPKDPLPDDQRASSSRASSAAGAILVTGASGFIGGRLVSRLARDAVAVRASSRHRPADLPSRVEFRSADINDASAHSALLAPVAGERVFCVIHVAGQLPGSHISEEDHRRTNGEAPARLLEAGRAAGIQRFVHVSSAGVLGDTGPAPVSEEARCRPVSAYERTKWEGESAVREAGRSHAIPVAVIRPSLVYGPGDRHLLGRFRSVKKNRVMWLLDGGRALAHPVHVDDLVEALVLCARRPEPVSGVYLIAGERPVPFGEFLAEIARAADRSPVRLSIPLAAARAAAVVLEGMARRIGRVSPLNRERLSAIATDHAFDTSRARRELGWTPRVGLAEGLRSTADWYRGQGLL